MRNLSIFLITFLLIPAICFAESSRTFTSNNDEVNFGDLDFDATDQLTIAAWARPTFTNATGEQAYAKVIDKCASNCIAAPYVLYALGVDGGSPAKFNCDISNGTTIRSALGTSALSSNTWYFLACTYDKSNLNLWVNATNEKTTANTDDIGNVASNGKYGHNQSGVSENNQWAGQIAYGRLHDDDLSYVELQNARWLPESIPRNLKALHPLWGSNSPEIDLSGNSITGTVSSTTASTDGPPVMFGGGLPL